MTQPLNLKCDFLFFSNFIFSEFAVQIQLVPLRFGVIATGRERVRVAGRARRGGGGGGGGGGDPRAGPAEDAGVHALAARAHSVVGPESKRARLAGAALQVGRVVMMSPQGGGILT